MSSIRFKICKTLEVEYIYDIRTGKFGFKLLFKFNTHNANWLYLNLNTQKIEKIKQILEICNNDFNKKTVKMN